MVTYVYCTGDRLVEAKMDYLVIYQFNHLKLDTAKVLPINVVNIEVSHDHFITHLTTYLPGVNKTRPSLQMILTQSCISFHSFLEFKLPLVVTNLDFL